MPRFSDLKKLDRKTRNRLRAALAQGNDSLSALSKIRINKQSKIKLIDGVLSHQNSSILLGEIRYFPQKPRFSDKIPAPVPKPFNEVMNDVVKACLACKETLRQCIESIEVINKSIVTRSLEEAADLIECHLVKHGWSHAILRKIVFIRSITKDDIPLIEDLIWQAGLSNNNIVITSLIHCFAEEQNYLSAKQAVMNIPDRGVSNALTRYLSRIAYQPLCRDEADLCMMLQSAMGCSLIDGVIAAKLNSHLISNEFLVKIQFIFDQLSNCVSIEEIASLYSASELDVDTEYSFFKQNSTWLEIDEIRQYRFLVDNFYDATENPYVAINEETTRQIELYINSPSHETLKTDGALVRHRCKELETIQQKGTVTRSAAFNYWLYSTQGDVSFDRDELLALMAATRDLSRTAPITATRNTALLAKDKTVKLVLLLLLYKRSKNERDEHRLRQILQELVLKNYAGSLANLVREFSKQHPAVAEYIYDTATEDFIAKLTKITNGAGDITSTRSMLHTWRSEVTGNSYYSDRARAILIDHQLNKIRDEIDDNRIYVDASRFSSWINDEVMLDLNSALTTSKVKSKTISTVDEAVLASVLERCYAAFCTNSVFGIASYLGRRIRHGTFKGQLFTGLIKPFENDTKYSKLFNDHQFIYAWENWKYDYGKLINEVIVDQLHIESKDKPAGFLRPHINDSDKQEILQAGVKNIIQAYETARSTDSLDVILTEYCWRLLDIDLRTVKIKLKELHRNAKQLESLTSIPAQTINSNYLAARNLTRSLINALDSRMMAMQTWFQKPMNVSPRAALSLLYAAVVSEVREEFPDFQPGSTPSDPTEIEIIGGAYHIVYDCLYVVIYNAAKHGTKPVISKFTPIKTSSEIKISITISSGIKSGELVESVSAKLLAAQESDLNTAHLRDHRSGIAKLRQLEQNCKELTVDFIGVKNDSVTVEFSLNLLSMT